LAGSKTPRFVPPPRETGKGKKEKKTKAHRFILLISTPFPARRKLDVASMPLTVRNELAALLQRLKQFKYSKREEKRGGGKNFPGLSAAT